MNMRAGALGAFIVSLALAGCDRDVTQVVKINTLTGPSAPECSDGDNNDPWEDELVDEKDPGCHTDGDAGNPNSYNRFDNSEATGPGGPPPASGPGSFRQEGGVICSPLDASRAERPIGFSWTGAGAGATYRVEEKIIGGGSDEQWREVQNNGSLSIRLERRRWSHQHFYRVTATLNGVSRLWDNGVWEAPCEKLADPAPVATPPPGPGPSGPGPSGPTCMSGQNFSPFGATHQRDLVYRLQLNPTVAGCAIRFRSSNPNYVSVSSGGSVTFLNPGCALIDLNGGAPAQFCTTP